MLQSDKARTQRVLFYLVLIVPFMIFTSYVLDTVPFLNEHSMKMLTQAIILSAIIHGWLKFVLETGGTRNYLEFQGITKIGIGVIFGLCAALLVVVVDNLLGITTRTFNPSLLSSSALKILVTSIIFFVSESYIEEMITRGYVLEEFEEMHHPRRAVIFSSLVFVLVQFFWDNPAVSLLGWLNFYILAFLLGLLYLCTKAKWLCIGFHTAWNLVFTTFFPAEVSHHGHFANYVHMESWSTLILLLILVGVSMYKFEKHNTAPDNHRRLGPINCQVK